VSWWQVVPEVLLLTIATVAWVRELRRRRAKRVRLAARDKRQAEGTRQGLATSVAEAPFGFGNVELPGLMAYTAVGSWAGNSGWLTDSLFADTTSQPNLLTSGNFSGLSNQRLAIRVTELENRVAELEQRLGQERRNRAVGAARIREWVLGAPQARPVS
jgi:hypothetical protein